MVRWRAAPPLRLPPLTGSAPRPAVPQVEGLAAGCSAQAAAQLAALGAAASWRLGKWDSVEGYVQAANAGFGQLDTDARWEVRRAGGS